ncbi:MAG: CheR family methyltransferase [Planctomycetota bacterium]
MNAFADIELLLEQWIGLDASTVGQATVHRAVRQRMQAAGIDDPAAYARLVRADPAARDQLVEDVIVAESWFFRDRQVFDFVVDFAVTRAALPGRTPVRILCAPAAAGEEPYSVAMALLEAGLPAEQFVIDAIDISRRSLERAAAGRYSANAFRNADLAFRDRWFTSEAGQAVLAEPVRRQVRLEWANILDAGFAAGRPHYDVVFCRNLLIYLTDAARRRVEAQLDRLVAADGLLVLGAAEPPIMKGDWIPAGSASVFALRRGVHAGRRSPVAGREPQRPPLAPAATAGERAGPVKRPSSPDGRTPATSLEQVLGEAGRLANEGRLAEAIDLCERQRAFLPPSPELFFLMGMLHQSAGDADRAEGCFHKTLYLDADHEEAHLALALVARQRGDTAMAEKYRQSAARAAARKGTSR